MSFFIKVIIFWHKVNIAPARFLTLMNTSFETNVSAIMAYANAHALPPEFKESVSAFAQYAPKFVRKSSAAHIERASIDAIDSLASLAREGHQRLEDVMRTEYAFRKVNTLMREGSYGHAPYNRKTRAHIGEIIKSLRSFAYAALEPPTQGDGAHHSSIEPLPEKYHAIGDGMYNPDDYFKDCMRVMM